MRDAGGQKPELGQKEMQRDSLALGLGSPRCSPDPSGSHPADLAVSSLC